MKYRDYMWVKYRNEDGKGFFIANAIMDTFVKSCIIFMVIGVGIFLFSQITHAINIVGI